MERFATFGKDSTGGGSGGGGSGGRRGDFTDEREAHISGVVRGKGPRGRPCFGS